MSQLETDQLQVNKHIRIQSGDGLIKLDIHASRNCIGGWLKSRPDDAGTIGIFAGGSFKLPSLFVYPEKEYFKDSKGGLPFAISANGLQVPHPDGRVTLLPLSDIAALVDKIANEQK